MRTGLFAGRLLDADFVRGAALFSCSKSFRARVFEARGVDSARLMGNAPAVDSGRSGERIERALKKDSHDQDTNGKSAAVRWARAGEICAKRKNF